MSDDPAIRRPPRTLIAGAIIVVGFVVAALVGPLVSGTDPTAMDLGATLLAPCAAHPLGTDNLGRDVLARVIFGARIDLQIGLFLMLPSLVLGSLVGMIAGYRGGSLDRALMRLSDVVQAFPGAVLTVAVVAALGPSLVNLYLVGAALGWIAYARLVRSEVRVQKSLDYVLAARALGSSETRILLRHVTPHIAVQAAVLASSGFVQGILLGSTLGFLGLGAQPPAPEWGLMIADGRSFLVQAPWMSVAPGLAMVVLAAGASLVGDGIADWLRPGRRSNPVNERSTAVNDEVTNSRPA